MNKINALWIRRKEIIKEMRKRALPVNFFFHSMSNGGARFVLWRLGERMIQGADHALFLQLVLQVNSSSLKTKILQVSKWLQDGAIHEDMREALITFLNDLKSIECNRKDISLSSSLPIEKILPMLSKQ